MKVALYARVSTKDKGQDTENQLSQLRAYAAKMDYNIFAEYEDSISGSGKLIRPMFDLMFENARKRKFDLLLFWSLDRLSREGVLETLNYLKKLNDYKVDWKSYTEQYLDSTGIFKEAIISIIATIAKQERIRLSERVKAGLEIARGKGKEIGRPKVIFRRDRALELRQAGQSIRSIGRLLGVSATVVARELGSVPKPSFLLLEKPDVFEPLPPPA